LRVEDVEVRKADLEDVFLDVMSKHGDKPPPARPAEAGKGRSPSSPIDEVTGLEVGSS